MAETPTPERDEVLVDRARRGDAEAFRMIFERHGPAVRRFLGQAFRDEGDADEAAQETFLRAHRKLAALRDAARLRPWLLGIARIVLLDTLGRRRDPLAPEDPPDRIDDEPGPEERLLSAEADAVLGKELDRLSAERRAALALRLDQHLSYDEIASVMGWPLQKVKNEIHRARLRLRGGLLAYLKGGG